MTDSFSADRQTVLFILPNLAGGGAERAALIFLRRLDRGRYRPMLAMLKAEGELLESVPADVPTFVGLAGLIGSAGQADIVIGALELTATYVAVLAGGWLGRPVIGWVHTNLGLYPPARRWTHRLCQRIFYPRLDGIWACSESAADSVRESFPGLQDKIRVLHNPVDLQRIRRLAGEVREQLQPTPMVLGVGKLDRNKGFDLAIRMHAILRQRAVSQHLVVLGTGPERTSLLLLAQELGVSDSVFLPGYVSNPYSWMAQAAVIILPSQMEGLSTVVIEALALGRPVVSSDCPGGLKEFAIDEPAAIVPVDDIRAMADAVQRVLEDKAVQARFGEKGPLVASQYQPEQAVGRLEELLRQL